MGRCGCQVITPSGTERVIVDGTAPRVRAPDRLPCSGREKPTPVAKILPWPSANKTKPKPKPTPPALEPRRLPPQASVRGVTASEEELVARAVKFGSTLASEILRPKVKRGLTRAAGDNGTRRRRVTRGSTTRSTTFSRSSRTTLGFRVESVASKGDQDRGHGLQPSAGRGARAGATSAGSRTTGRHLV